jgi:hypothetical protein
MVRIAGSAESPRNFREIPLTMRALKVLLITLLALGALVLILFLIGPSRTVVERTVAMNAPASVIYPKIASLETMHG